ncbi:hypothetical protein NL676_005337 [Syzygium grande]|nr:hypothetical protein NL676_005337 [Syzygium grande]
MFLDPPVAAEFSARFDPSGPLGFIEEAFEFMAKRSEFLAHVGAERDVAAVLRAVREKQKQKQKAEAKVGREGEGEGAGEG